MALVNRSFSVNVTPGTMPPIVHVSEYDVGRAYTVSIIDEQGNTFTIPSETTASIEGTLNGSVGFTQSATVSNNQVSFTLSQSMTAYSGKAWCKIKLTQNSQPIQTCAFVLAVDRAGVEADTIIGAPGFQEQINEGIAEYFDNDPPFFELPSGGQSGQALLSDGSNGAYWGQAQGGGGSGITDEVKQAMLACFRNVAWINDQGQTYYDALYAALYPPADLVSISAIFNQGQNIVYNTDSLDSLKQYLTVTAHYSNSSTQIVTSYTLSGTLTVGTSVITVSYGGKTTTFNVTVSAGTIWDFQWDYTKGKLEDQDGWGSDISDGSSELVTGAERITAASGLSSYFQILPTQGSTLRTMTNGIGVIEVVFVGRLNMSSTTSDGFRITAAESSSNRIGINTVTGKFRIRDNSDRVSGTAIADYQNGTEYTVRLVMKGTTVDIYINGTLVAENTTPISQSGSTNSVFVSYLGSGYYVDLKSLKLKIGSIS